MSYEITAYRASYAFKTGTEAAALRGEKRERLDAAMSAWAQGDPLLLVAYRNGQLAVAGDAS
jgi:hypothetical protein